ncbi:MAG: catechol 2,3-dioxygenase-like lactoylglutathione lyase family enzyme [Pseudohongiellaceae bacterium]|jgi:catechol 2,3-dioxygenase-like lactoylglutathione lyase family enzyme
MHINVSVENIADSIKFYNALFGAEPVKAKADYAKWMLDDPRVNFAISNRTEKSGVDHLGIQVEKDEELEQLRERLKNADMALFDEGEDVCCYARSEKSWVKDPSGVIWEAYKTMADVQLFSGEEVTKKSIDGTASKPKSNCCPAADTSVTNSAGAAN